MQASPAGHLVVHGSWISSSGLETTPVYIRWNSQTGPILAETPVSSNGTFSINVPIPDVAPGVYFLVATSGEFGIARTPVEVIGSSVAEKQGNGPDVRTSSSDLWNGFAETSDAGSVSSAQPGRRTGAGAVSAGGLTLVAFGLASLASAGYVIARRRRSESSALSET